MSIRDIRRTAFCWQDKAALRALRAFYDGDNLKRRATALAIYVVLTELASDQYSQMQVSVTHRAIWKATGTSEATVKRYLREFEALGLIAVERRRIQADVSLPNIYTLLTLGATDEPSPSAHDMGEGVAGEPTPCTGEPPLEPRTINNGKEEEMTDKTFMFYAGAGLPADVRLALKRAHTRRGALDRAGYAAAARARRQG